MRFTANYLSASNISNIFLADSIDAETATDDVCIIRRKYICSLWVDLEENMIRFSSYLSTFNLKKEDIIKEN